MEEMQTRPNAPFQGGERPLAATDPEWVAITTAFAGQEVPAASPLTEKERMLCILAALLGCPVYELFQTQEDRERATADIAAPASLSSLDLSMRREVMLMAEKIIQLMRS